MDIGEVYVMFDKFFFSNNCRVMFSIGLLN